MTDAQQQQAFPFLKLPPELRVIVYNMTLDEELHCKSSTLHEMKLPALLQTCKQMRHEAMQNFSKAFARTHVNVLVASNLQARKSRRTKCPFTTAQDLQREDEVSGVLGLEAGQEDFWRAAGVEAVLFRNFTLHVYSATNVEWIKHVRSGNLEIRDREELLRERARLKVFEVRIVATRGQNSEVEVIDGLAHPERRELPSRTPGWFDHEDVALAKLRLRTVISKFDSQSGGFTLKEIQCKVKALRM